MSILSYKTKMSVRMFIIFMISAIISLTVFTSGIVSAAGDALIYVTPASSSMEVGNTRIFDLRLNTNTSTVDTVQIDLNFDTNKFSFVSVEANAGEFQFIIEESHSNGHVRVIATNPVPKSGDIQAASLTLKAEAGTGSSSISLNNSETFAILDGVDQLSSTVGATVNFTSPTPDPQPDPDPQPEPTPQPTPSPDPEPDSGTEANSSSNTTTTDSSNVATTAGSPVLTAEDIGAIGFNSASASLSTNEPTTATLRLGVSPGSLAIAIESSKLQQTHSFNIDNSLLTHGSTFYYQFVATDENGYQTKSEVKSFTTRGYPITVTLTDKQSELVSDWEVTLFSDPITAITNKEGVAVFENTAAGQHRLEIDINGEKFSKDIIIEDTLGAVGGIIDQNASPQTQIFAFEVNQDFPNSLSTVQIIVYVIAVVLGIVFLLIFMKRVKQVSHSLGTKGAVIQDNTRAPEVNGPEAGSVIFPSNGSAPPESGQDQSRDGGDNNTPAQPY